MKCRSLKLVGMLRRHQYNVPVPTWMRPHCGFVHKSADLHAPKFLTACPLLFVILQAFTILGSASNTPQASALVQHAVEVSNVRSADVGSFRLHAIVSLHADPPVEADYLLIWSGPNRWREEILLGNVKAIRIGGQNTISTKNDSAEAQIIRSRLGLLDLPAVLYLKPSYSLGSVKSRTKSQVKMQCLSRTVKQFTKDELCFDSNTGVLLLDESANSTTEYSKYSAFRGKLFPTLVTTSYGRKLVEAIEVQELTYNPNQDPVLFHADAEYKTIAGCEHPVVPTPVSTPDPEYPAQLRTRNPQVVSLSAIVNEAGAVENVLVTSSPAPLDVYAITALRKWKFTPATCSGVPVPFQFSTNMNFRTKLDGVVNR